MGWKVTIKRRKNLSLLPVRILEVLNLLVTEIEVNGPVRGNWKNYGKLSKTKHHCHLKSGRTTYVACWEETKKGIEIEVYYVGTHERAPY